MSSYFLGIDGGQSSTTALIGDGTGRIAGYGRGGPCNHVKGPEGRTKFVNAIRECVGQAMQGKDLPIEALCGGFSGGPTDKEALLKEMFPRSRVFVTTDALIALTGATSGAPGIITIAGTGSIAFGRNSEGRSARAGGWGYVFGDEGGGFDLTRQALRAVLREEEGWGPRTSLTPLLLDATGTTSANELLHHFYTTDWPRPKIARLSRIVDQAAADGDPLAIDLIHAAAQQLAGYTAAIRGMLFRPGEPARVAWIGGVFRSERLLERYRTIVELEEANTLGPPDHGPAAGALLEAYRLAGLAVTLSNLPDSEK
jgi:N-acetylglucosamine kinase-like BadF-type ATPase